MRRWKTARQRRRIRRFAAERQRLKAVRSRLAPVTNLVCINGGSPWEPVSLSVVSESNVILHPTSPKAR